MIFKKTENEIAIMREGAKKLSEMLLQIKKGVKPGVTTKDLEGAAQALFLKNGLESNFKDYQGYPSLLCTSVNNVVVHGIPSGYELKLGDIVSLDIGLRHKGYNCDMSITVPVGKITPEIQTLLRTTKKALKIGIGAVREGGRFGDIGFAIQNFTEREGFSVIRDLCGHGIGRELHEDPQILNYGKKGSGPKIERGMVFCIEPMITNGDWRVKRGEDDYSFITADGSLAAHYEHMVAVTDKGVEVLTFFE